MVDEPRRKNAFSTCALSPRNEISALSFSIIRPLFLCLNSASVNLTFPCRSQPWPFVERFLLIAISQSATPRVPEIGRGEKSLLKVATGRLWPRSLSCQRVCGVSSVKPATVIFEPPKLNSDSYRTTLFFRREIPARRRALVFAGLCNQLR